MDQFASLFGKEGSLIRLDTRSMEYKYFPFNPQATTGFTGTAVKHELASSAYNKRRESCENAARVVRENGHPTVEFSRMLPWICSRGKRQAFRGRFQASRIRCG
jgi:galactokinase